MTFWPISRFGCFAILLSFLLLGHGVAIAQGFGGPVVVPYQEDEDKKEWQEVDAPLPPPPQEASLQRFYVSAMADNVFQIDLASLSVGSDGVIRYVLVVQTPGGGRNVSFEGMRCETRERRLYAFGRPDGTWAMARSKQWAVVENKVVNRHHAALMTEYFCPDGIAVRTADEAVAVLRAGGRPGLKH